MRKISRFKAAKWMMSLDPRIQRKLERAANKSGLTVQELLRARIIPDWLYGPPVVSNRTIQRLQAKGLINNDGEKKPD